MLLLLFLILLINAQDQQDNNTEIIIPETSNKEDPIYSSIIYGSSDLGYYYVNIYIGTPPQKQSVIIDTGSSITTFPCNECKSCGKHQDSYYDARQSNTSVIVDCNSKIGLHKCDRCDTKKQCIFSISYAEGSSLFGFFIQDYVLFGDLLLELNTNQLSVFGVFGCTTRETNLFYTQLANGILGLSPKTNSEFSFPNVVDNLYNEKHIKYFFSICIGRIDGYMTIGQYNTHRHQSNSAYYTIPFFRPNGKDVYGIKISSIKVGDRTISAGSELQGSFVDSGSTLVNASPQICDAMKELFQCKSEQQQNKCPERIILSSLPCYKYNETLHKTFEEFSQMFPTYTFKLDNNFNFEWKPIDYLTKDLDFHEAYCLPVAEYYGSSKLILGQVWMRNWDIGFDRDHDNLIFVKTQCTSDPLEHNLTDITSQELKYNTNSSIKTRQQPKDIVEEFFLELFKILGVLAFTSIIIILVIYWNKRRRIAKKPQKLPEIDDQTQPKQVQVQTS